ncbi:hypothetical protein PR048_012338 [Dryococelus australis]|uniref:Uncharacterized protein n=1 Tax=Dryococelus australis TaxID=614101 RepID=A0ABQ9HP48_9NEOP|nr:hypothetical protein PR048_012338 [Dryococelus australis]
MQKCNRHVYRGLQSRKIPALRHWPPTYRITVRHLISQPVAPANIAAAEVGLRSAALLINSQNACIPLLSCYSVNNTAYEYGGYFAANVFEMDETLVTREMFLEMSSSGAADSSPRSATGGREDFRGSALFSQSHAVNRRELGTPLLKQKKKFPAATGCLLSQLKATTGPAFSVRSLPTPYLGFEPRNSRIPDRRRTNRLSHGSLTPLVLDDLLITVVLPPRERKSRSFEVDGGFVSRAVKNQQTDNYASCLSFRRHRHALRCEAQPKIIPAGNVPLECKRETGDPRENPATSGIVRHESHMRISGNDAVGSRTWFTKESTTEREVHKRLNIGRDVVVVRLFTSHQGEPGSFPGFFTYGNSSGRCRWLVGFLGDLPFPRALHSAAAPYSLRFTLVVYLKTSMLRATQISPITYRRNNYGAAPECKGVGIRGYPRENPADFPWGNQFVRRRSRVREADEIDFEGVYTEVTFAIGSQFIRHALDDSAPTADLQENNKRIPYCKMWDSTGATANVTCRPAASPDTILTREIPGVTSPEIESDSPRWEATSLTTTPPRPSVQMELFADKIDLKRVYTEVAFAIGSEFIIHALDDSAPIVDLQGNKKRIPYCQMWGNTGATASNKHLRFD